MKHYLIRYWRGLSVLPVEGRQSDFASLDDAMQYLSRVYAGMVQLGERAVYRSGWPYWTVIEKVKNMSPTAPIFSGVGLIDATFAYIYEIDVPAGKTAHQVYDDWHAEDERLKKVARAAELAQQGANAREKLPCTFEGRCGVVVDYDEYEIQRLALEFGDYLESWLINDVFGIGITHNGEVIDLGKLRITIERVESDEE